MKKTIDIICPLYNAEKFIDKLHISFFKQKLVKINEIKYILTESKDNTEKYLKEKGIRRTKSGIMLGLGEKEEEVMWICRNCGHVYVGKTALKVCPVCKHPESFMEMKAENY